MIKAEKAEELLKTYAIGPLSEELAGKGYKYSKARKSFIKRDDTLDFAIYMFINRPSLVYDDEEGRLYLSLRYKACVESARFEKWYTSLTGEVLHLEVGIESRDLLVAIPMDGFSRDDFSRPSASMRFKQLVTLSLAAGRPEGPETIEHFRNATLPALLREMESYVDIRTIVEKSKNPFQYIPLLVFVNLPELAAEKAGQLLQMLREEVADSRQGGEAGRAAAATLSEFLRTYKILTGKTLGEPVSPAVGMAMSAHGSLRLAGNVFEERARLAIRGLEISNVEVNERGEAVLFANKSRILKFDAGGKVRIDHGLETTPGYGPIVWEVPSGRIPGTDDFFINNILIRSDNSLQILPLGEDLPAKAKKLKDPNITDLAFSGRTGRYWLLYGDMLLIYDSEGRIAKETRIAKSNRNRILIEKEWLLVQEDKKSFAVVDENGATIRTFEYAAGNTEVCFSKARDAVVFHGYSTKSQYYDIQRNEKKALWAHPTYVKGYTEELYGDVEQNFGMDIAQFSPNDAFIVGGAWHGKYAAWKLPGLERTELIPNQSAIAEMEPWTRNSSDGTGGVAELPRVHTLNGVDYFKNRRNAMTNILFLPDGHFATEIGSRNLLLVWDGDFACVSSLKVEGKIEMHGDRYLTELNRDELRIYERA